MITKEENLILQSYMTVSLFAELGNNNFFSSNYFSEMKFGFPEIKNLLQANGIDNQGSLIMSLYAMLVVPYELIQERYPSEFSTMNDFLKSKIEIIHDTYTPDPSVYVFMYHIRNAVAHCRISFIPGSIVFIDSNRNQTKQFEGKLTLPDVCEFIDKLQREVVFKVIKDIQSRQ